MQTCKQEECQSVIATIEQRVEGIACEDDYAHAVMNELANLLRKHQHFDMSV